MLSEDRIEQNEPGKDIQVPITCNNDELGSSIVISNNMQRHLHNTFGTDQSKVSQIRGLKSNRRRLSKNLKKNLKIKSIPSDEKPILLKMFEKMKNEKIGRSLNVDDEIEPGISCNLKSGGTINQRFKKDENNVDENVVKNDLKNDLKYDEKYKNDEKGLLPNRNLIDPVKPNSSHRGTDNEIIIDDERHGMSKMMKNVRNDEKYDALYDNNALFRGQNEMKRKPENFIFAEKGRNIDKEYLKKNEKYDEKIVYDEKSNVLVENTVEIGVELGLKSDQIPPKTSSTSAGEKVSSIQGKCNSPIVLLPNPKKQPKSTVKEKGKKSLKTRGKTLSGGQITPITKYYSRKSPPSSKIQAGKRKRNSPDTTKNKDKKSRLGHDYELGDETT